MLHNIAILSLQTIPLDGFSLFINGKIYANLMGISECFMDKLAPNR